MAVDTPAHIVVLGAGPSGLEAALYARFLGYDVTIIERGPVCEQLVNRDAGEITKSAKQYCSRLGVAAMLAQDEMWWPPDPEAVLSGPQLRDAYFLPLSESDLISGSLETDSQVVSIERAEEPSEADDADYGIDELDADETLPFRVQMRDAKGKERSILAHVLIDATGDSSSANWDLGRLLAIDDAHAEPSVYILEAGNAFDDPQHYLAQIRQVFAIVGGRANLDLYRTIQLPPEWQAFPIPKAVV